MKNIAIALISLFPAVALAKMPSCAYNVWPFDGVGYVRHIVQNGRVVYSNKMHLDYATVPEYFTVTATRTNQAQGVDIPGCPVSGVVHPGVPLEFTHLASTRHRMRIKGQLITSYALSGREFTLIALQHNEVEFLGTVARLVRMKTRIVHGKISQVPVVREFYVDKRVRLVPGQSAILPVGGFRVRLTRNTADGTVAFFAAVRR